MAEAKLYNEAKAGGASTGKKEIEHYRYYPGEKGGAVVEHHFKMGRDYMHHEPEKHPFTEPHEAISHLMKEVGVEANEVSGHEGEDTEEPGGKSKSDTKKKVKKAPKRTVEEEKGED